MTERGGKLLGLAAAVVFGGAALLWDSPAYAKHRSFRSHHGRQIGGHVFGRNRPIWHGSSVHYDRYFHPTFQHWTPYRGLHTHGHYHSVPHYVPGHYDRHHRGHIDLNPRFHR